MWPKVYKDYPPDTDLKHEQIESNKGIVGCEMHELNGWGDSLHRPLEKKEKGFIMRLKERISKYIYP